MRWAPCSHRFEASALRIAVLTALFGVLAPAAFAGGDGVAAIARVAKDRGGKPLTLTFQPEACTLTAVASGAALVPVRAVAWSITKATDGTNDAIVTARCAKGACVTGGRAAVPRFSFRLVTSARVARAMLKDLKGLAAHCATK